MKVPKTKFILSALLITIISFFLEMSILFCIVGLAAIWHIIDFNWGYMFVLWVFISSYRETKTLMKLNGIEIEEEDE